MNLSIDRSWFQEYGNNILVLLWDHEERVLRLEVLEPIQRVDLKKLVLKLKKGDLLNENIEDYIDDILNTIELFDSEENEDDDSSDDLSERENPAPDAQDLSNLSLDELKDLNRKIQNLLREIQQGSRK